MLPEGLFRGLGAINKSECAIHVFLELRCCGFATLTALVLDHEIQLKIIVQMAKPLLLAGPGDIVIVGLLKDVGHQRDARPVLRRCGEPDCIEAIFHKQQLAQADIADGICIKSVVDPGLNLVMEQLDHLRNGFHAHYLTLVRCAC